MFLRTNTKKMASILVRGFNLGTSETVLQDHFSACGLVQSVSMGTGNWSDSAVVTYSSAEEARDAVEVLSGTVFGDDDHVIEVTIHFPDKKTRKRKAKDALRSGDLCGKDCGGRDANAATGSMAASPRQPGTAVTEDCLENPWQLLLPSAPPQN
eukprot:gnl/TRDRNA2_/TRDRNA2_75488_c0_seq1.p1 gnl/TRDRNA2_/TRDRNA2_75488_c0~~gnl/TRDRNA2_/TRDRNA2_75488_c0_seq1.p1  ORF type:complete len:154 (+),score=25.39 gnl/TRDRNA2_/TRDRNA2_75488_c0_seq1:3-464(+)